MELVPKTVPLHEVPLYHLYKIVPPEPPDALHIIVRGLVPVGLLTDEVGLEHVVEIVAKPLEQLNRVDSNPLI